MALADAPPRRTLDKTLLQITRVSGSKASIISTHSVEKVIKQCAEDVDRAILDCVVSTYDQIRRLLISTKRTQDAAKPYVAIHDVQQRDAVEPILPKRITYFRCRGFF